MVKYNCDICKYNTNIKTQFNRHLNTKKHKNNHKDLGIEIEKKNTTPHKYSQILTNSPPNPHKSSQTLTNTHKFTSKSSQILTNPHKFC